MLKPMGKKICTIYAQKLCLSKPMMCPDKFCEKTTKTKNVTQHAKSEGKPMLYLNYARLVYTFEVFRNGNLPILLLCVYESSESSGETISLCETSCNHTKIIQSKK